MTRPLSFIAASVLLTGSALAQAPEGDGLDQEADAAKLARDEAAISAAIHRVETAWLEGDAASLSDNFRAGGLYIGFGAAQAQGRSEIASHFARNFSGLFTETKLEHIELNVRFLSDDVALTSYEALIAPQGDAAKPACSPLATAVLTRQPSEYDVDGVWEIEYLALADEPFSDCAPRSATDAEREAP